MTKDEKIKDLKAQLAASRRQLKTAGRLLSLATDCIPWVPEFDSVVDQIQDWEGKQAQVHRRVINMRPRRMPNILGQGETN